MPQDNTSAISALPALPWNNKIEEIPFDTPVLVKEKNEEVPYMALRFTGDPDCVACLLYTSASPYGWYSSLTSLEKWLNVSTA